MAEDIQRHSTLDNYWCFVFERLVRVYKQQTTNMRFLCKTFADRAQQLHCILQVFTWKHANSTTSAKAFDIQNLTTPPILLHTKTEERGMELKEFLSALRHSSVSPPRALQKRNIPRSVQNVET